jgi:hypothetical protein
LTFVRLDLHKPYITVCALDSSGAIIAEAKRLAPDLDTLLAFFAPLSAPVTLAMEATLY